MHKNVRRKFIAVSIFLLLSGACQNQQSLLENVCSHLAFCALTGGQDIQASCVTTLQAELDADRANTEQVCQDIAVFKEQYLTCVSFADCTALNNGVACQNEWAQVSQVLTNVANGQCAASQ